jgi:CRP-like cAMP-binding protein
LVLNITGADISLYSLLVQHFIDIEPIQKISTGSYIFQEKDKVNNVYLLLSGKVLVGRVHSNGKEFILKLLQDDELIIEYEVFKPSPKYHFYAKALTNCEILKINKDQFEMFLINYPSALGALATFLSTRYIKSQIKCQDLIMNGKKGGLYSILIRLCNTYGRLTDNGIVIDLPLTQQELANFTFGAREVIQRMLKELRENDIITYEHHIITVRNIAYLKREVDCQNCGYALCGMN